MFLGIYGAGATAQELYEMIQNINIQKWQAIVFIDDTKEEGTFLNCPRMSFELFSKRYSNNEAEIIIAIGEPSVRKKLYTKIKMLGYSLPTIVHPDSYISPTAQLGEGCIVKMVSIISSNTVIGNNVYIQSNVIIGHDVVVNDNCQISSYSNISGHCTVGENVFIGVNSCIKEEISIGNNVIIGMAAAVMKNIESDVTVLGNPARVIAKDKDHKVFSR